MWNHPKDNFKEKLFEKIFTDTRYFAIYCIVAAAALTFVVQKCNRDSNYDKIKLDYLYLNLEFSKNAKIREKGIDKSNRNTPFIVFDDGKRWIGDQNLYDLVDVNDSVSKKKSSTEFIIYKKGKKIVYDYFTTSKGMRE